ncbi:MAG TPA: hypothetical protein VGK27_12565 [Candidatus Deferrimicrobiaceae bacterium]|jgi:hypothetical protein
MKKILILLTIGITSAMLVHCGGGNPAPVVGQPVQLGGSIQGISLALSNGVAIYAGIADTPGAIDCTAATSATFMDAQGITTDGTFLYVSDTGNQLIRKVNIGTGAVSTVAGTEGVSGMDDNTTGPGGTTFLYPQFITTDGTNLYLTEPDSNIVRKVVIATGAVTRFAGTGVAASVDNIDRLQAQFNSPRGITTEGTNLYVSDYSGNVIRKIEILTGKVTTLAGSGLPGADDNTTDGLSATFDGPWGLTTDGTNLYVSDRNNHKIRKVVIATGAVTTLAGSGTQAFADGTGTGASFNSPAGLTTDGTSLYVVDYRNNRIRKISIATGVVTTVAGNAVALSVDGNGAAAGFNMPFGITTDGHSLFVTDGNQTIRKIN